jgi:hypothetical protein
MATAADAPQIATDPPDTSPNRPLRPQIRAATIPKAIVSRVQIAMNMTGAGTEIEKILYGNLKSEQGDTDAQHLASREGDTWCQPGFFSEEVQRHAEQERK